MIAGSLKKPTRGAKVMVAKPSRNRPVAPQQRKKLTKAEKASEAGKFAAHLQRLLDERGWTTSDLADKLSIGEPAVRRWMRAEAIPGSLSLLQELGQALNTPSHPFTDWRLVLPAKV